MTDRACSLALVMLALLAACGSEKSRDNTRLEHPDQRCPNDTDAMGTLGEMVWCEKTTDTGAVVKHGPFRMWWPNGKPSQTGTYVDGQEDGQWTSWWENGNKQEEGTYVAGNKTGAWVSYHEPGSPAAKLSFDRGQLHGRQELLNAAGETSKIKCYRAGEKLWEHAPDAATADRSCP